jgi:DNA-binding transcriptional ArsR family regulator
VVNNIQYDNQSAVLGWQSRFRWIVKPGSDLYFVYVHNWLDDPLRNRFASLDRRASSKALYTHRFLAGSAPSTRRARLCPGRSGRLMVDPRRAADVALIRINGYMVAILEHMSALSDTTRCRMLLMLEKHELTVSELCSVLQMPQSSVSRHLKTLADDGWVASRRDATVGSTRCRSTISIRRPAGCGR